MSNITDVVFRLKQDNPDKRDLIYAHSGSPLREIVDLRQWASPIEDQLQLGSCSSNAMVGVYELLINKEEPALFVDLSRLFIYYNTRLIEGTIDIDSGAYIRDVIKSVKTYGVCKESIWPYDIDFFRVPPTVTSYADAKNRSIKDYYRVLQVHDMLDALNNNWPIIFGILLYDSFYTVSATDSMLTLPASTDNPIGGHAMVLVGYDLSRHAFLARNSFGKEWGLDGYCWIAFDYMEKSSMDAWIYNIDTTSAITAPITIPKAMISVTLTPEPFLL